MHCSFWTQNDSPPQPPIGYKLLHILFSLWVGSVLAQVAPVTVGVPPITDVLTEQSIYSGC